MLWYYGVWLLTLGVLGAANFIVAKFPNASYLLGKLTPYTGWYGLASLLGGFWDVIQLFGIMGIMKEQPPIGLIVWLLFLGTAVLQILLGAIFGVGAAKTFIKEPRAVEKMDDLLGKLVPFQGILGFAAIGVGVGLIVLDMLFGRG